MGAQAAGLLDAGGRIGAVPGPWVVAKTIELEAPEAYDLDRVARGHGGVGLAPRAYDGEILHGVLREGVRVRVHPDLRVELSQHVDAGPVLRHMLCLDDDLGDLHLACDRVPSLAWVRAVGAGRLLRAPTAFEDLAGVLASTNTSYTATRRMVGAVVSGPFPTPGEVLAHGEPWLRAAGWGYRAPWLLALAARADEVEQWTDPQVPDDQVLAGLLSLPGFGPFAAAGALPLLGHRPRPLVLDGWLRAQVSDPSQYTPMGRWVGTGVWLAITRHRGSAKREPGPRHGSRIPASP